MQKILNYHPRDPVAQFACWILTKTNTGLHFTHVVIELAQNVTKICHLLLKTPNSAQSATLLFPLVFP